MGKIHVKSWRLVSIQLLYLKLSRGYLSRGLKQQRLAKQSERGINHWVLLDKSEWNKWPMESSFELQAYLHRQFCTHSRFLFIVDQQALCKCLRKSLSEVEPMIQVLKAGFVVKILLVPGGNSMRRQRVSRQKCSLNVEFLKQALVMKTSPASSSRDKKSPKGSLFTPHLHSHLYFIMIIKGCTSSTLLKFISL